MRQLGPLTCLLVFVASASAAEKQKAPPTNEALKPATLAGLEWYGDLAAALEQAAAHKKLIFIDFTGETCTNCKINEKNVFVKSEVNDLFKQFVRVQLYSDVIPEGYYKNTTSEEKREKDAGANLEFQKAVFKTEQLPFYVIAKPLGDGQFEIVAQYDEGRINNIDKFVEFLKKPLN